MPTRAGAIRRSSSYTAARRSCCRTTYRRYLANIYRKVFRLQGTPVRIELRSGDNPYAGRRNPLTPRQQKKRERLMQHVKKRR
jgi:GTPase